jgi:S1-C subfamily serine protease
MAAYGLEHANALYSQKRPDASAPIEAHTQGRILFIKQVKGLENEVYRRLAIRFNALPSQFKVPVNNKQKNSDFGQSFEFAIEKKCWVLDHNDGDVQASAFMIEGNLLITCAHVFSKMNSETCSAYRIHDKFNKFTVNMVHIDKPRDIAIAKIQTQTPQAFEFFKTEETIEPNNGEKVSILGFPNVKAGATRVTRFWSTITNIFALSSVRWAQIDKEIFNGASGGPVLNSNHHVVGIVARGADDKESFNGFIMLNELNAVLQEHKNAQRVS